MIKEDYRNLGNGLRIYLAVPYSHSDFYVCEERFRLVNEAAGKLMRQGYLVFSPISHSHPIAMTIGRENALSHDFWLRQDYSYLDHWADEMWILTLPGWDQSTGIAQEMRYVYGKVRIPIRYLSPSFEVTSHK